MSHSFFAVVLLCALCVPLAHSLSLTKRESGLDAEKVRTAENKARLNEEFVGMVGHLREGCFPRPGGKGCRCVEKDPEGRDVEVRFGADQEQKCRAAPRVRRQTRRDQNVRDPVREQQERNYAAVLDELKNKFAGLRQGCYPRPKGCLCVVGKDATGREITERRMKDSDCKCRKDERNAECPAAGA